MGRLEVHPAALKNGVVEKDIRYVFLNPQWIYTDQGDWGLTMHVGFAQNGATLIEVGLSVVEDTDDVVVVHAMRVSKQRARDRYGL